MNTSILDSTAYDSEPRGYGFDLKPQMLNLHPVEEYLKLVLRE